MHLPDKSFLRLWNKNFLAEIYMNIQTLTFQVLREYSSWAYKNGVLQLFFQTSTRKMFWLCCGSIFFIMLSESKFLK